MNLPSSDVPAGWDTPVRQQYPFFPARRAGLLVHLGLILLLIGGGLLGLYQASRAQIGPAFLISLLPGLLAIILVPFLSYRLYGLWTAQYVLERDGLRLRWGLRFEHVPMDEIIWLHSQDELTSSLPMPWLRLPGSVLGVRQLPARVKGGGPPMIEYLASETRGMLFVGTEERVFAISPEDANGFLYTFQRLSEFGSLTPIAARSVYPSFLLLRVWSDLPARILTTTSLLISLVVLVWVSLAVASREQVHLGFYPNGAPGDLAPAVQLFLLPVLCSGIVLVDLFLGLFFFRRDETKDLSYLVWGSGAFIPLIFLLGTFFILRTG